ncbi:MAG: cyclic nucleotide-binding domain-containing protein [Pseudomonadota bacterium]|jgi:CRP-like cAMP-binding protein|nr:cyclic nucleotide-binding domain-containing protein [Syntrophaceae bacterium]MBP7033561.1 cyclic nucleotide-binding domain-containing protein [Syntrophobacterales bacterium]MDI9556154.1 cyclic nucleotide-binding domain-containing protein [Pseudomonadota bacterium]NLX32576.1 cyclic nucleotide-binding domain-containing protein [Deltaproteobacteria bacterium]HNU86240.1 cyclic nucleotide-binding domain-containing protein [Syntrophales bacterium]
MASAAFLKECNVFSGLSDAQIGKLVEIAREESFPTGTLLYKEGDPSTHLYLVEQGKVFLEMKSDMGPARPPMQVIIDVVTRREAFGWSAFVEPNLHTLSALIAEPTKMTVFDGGKMRALMEEDCEMGFEIMKGLTRLLASRLNHTRVLLIGERALAHLTSNTEYA